MSSKCYLFHINVLQKSLSNSFNIYSLSKYRINYCYLHPIVQIVVVYNTIPSVSEGPLDVVNDHLNFGRLKARLFILK
jgi:hypothetical protein